MGPSLIDEVKAWKNDPDPDNVGEYVQKLRVFLDNFVGEFSPSGLKNAGRVQLITLSNTSWTALPATPLVDRNAISVQNNTTSEIKINYTTGVGYVGMTIPVGGERSYDIKDTIVIYARAKTGTPIVEVEELS